jgi:hypothetical protein
MKTKFRSALAASATSVEALRRCVDQSGLAASEIAERMRDKTIRLRVTERDVERWLASDSEHIVVNPLERAFRLIRAMRNTLPLQWLCSRLGGFFCFGMGAFEERSGLLPEWYRVIRKLHDLRAAIVDAYADDQVFDREETTHISVTWSLVETWMEGFVQWKEGKNHSSPLPPTARLVSLRTLSSSETLRIAYDDEVGAGIKTLAAELQLSASMLQKWGEIPGRTGEQNSGTANPIDYILKWTVATGSPTAAMWLLEHCGGFFAGTHPKRLTGSTIEYPAAWHRAHLEMAELDATVTRAVYDGTLSHADIAAIRKEWEDVKAWTQCFVDSNELRQTNSAPGQTLPA